MTKDKPNWWQSWVTYAIVGLLVTVGPYVGGYLLLGKHESGFQINGSDRDPSRHRVTHALLQARHSEEDA